MEATARQTYILMSHRKIRRVINEVRGKNAVDARNILALMPYRAAKVVLAKLTDAVHNARIKFGESIRPENLFINNIQADEGPAYRRFKPRAQGRIYKREKPTTHLTVSVKVVEGK